MIEASSKIRTVRVFCIVGTVGYATEVIIITFAFARRRSTKNVKFHMVYICVSVAVAVCKYGNSEHCCLNDVFVHMISTLNC